MFFFSLHQLISGFMCSLETFAVLQLFCRCQNTYQILDNWQLGNNPFNRAGSSDCKTGSENNCCGLVSCMDYSKTFNIKKKIPSTKICIQRTFSKTVLNTNCCSQCNLSYDAVLSETLLLVIPCQGDKAEKRFRQNSLKYTKCH